MLFGSSEHTRHNDEATRLHVRLQCRQKTNESIRFKIGDHDIKKFELGQRINSTVDNPNFLTLAIFHEILLTNLAGFKVLIDSNNILSSHLCRIDSQDPRAGPDVQDRLVLLWDSFEDG